MALTVTALGTGLPETTKFIVTQTGDKGQVMRTGAFTIEWRDIPALIEELKWWIGQDEEV